MIGQTISHYRILEKIGQGGMGVVYLAEDTRSGRKVALKFLPGERAQNPEAIARFEREARAASALNHPHICAVHDIGEHEGHPFIVMEVLEGEPLPQLIEAGPLPADRIIEIGAQVADALEAAHAKGIVHRDVKPANIYVTDRGASKLLDFGLAKSPQDAPAMTGAGTEALLSSPGAMLGTLAYMSPEQVRGETVDARTDLFSLGAVLYEMTTGRQAFPGETPGTICDAILNRAPIPVARIRPQTSPRLESIIDKALEKDRTLRYQSAAELRADLQRLKRDSDASIRSPERHGRAPAWLGWRASAASAVAVTALVIAALRFGGFRSSPESIGSIAVLPFVNSSGDADSEYLSDGITESLISNLSQLSRLRVTARSTVFRYKGAETDPRKIGEDLGVRVVLSGRLLQRDGMVIVRTELMDIATGSQIWGGQYSRRTADVFVLQDELSTEISDRLRLRLSTEEKQRLTKRNTSNAEAYQLYLKGRYYWNKRSPDGILRAIEYFNGAINADPGYALAYSGLADTYSQMSFFNMSAPNEAMPKAKAAAAKALQIDSRLADAHIALAYASFTYDWDWPAATRHFDEAMSLNRDAVLDHPYYAFYLTVAGRSAEAVDVARHAFNRDPIAAAASHTLAVQLALGRRVDEAIAECHRTIELDPSIAVAHDVLSGLYSTKGLLHEALAEAEKAAELNRGAAMSVASVGYVRAHLGDRVGARQILARLAEMSKSRYTPALASAIVHVGLGENEQALTWLERAYEERFNRLAYLAREPVWDPLRQEPRFQDLLLRIKLPH